MYNYDKEVLLGVVENPNISRNDLLKLARHYDIEVARSSIETRVGLTRNLSFLGEFLYNEDLADTAMNVGLTEGYKELAREIVDMVSKESHPDMVKVSLRTIANPFLIHALVQGGVPEILLALSRNVRLTSPTIDLLLNTNNRDIFINIAEVCNISESQMKRMVDLAVERNDFELYTTILSSPFVNAHTLNVMLNDRVKFYEKIVAETLPFISEETKLQIMNELEAKLTKGLENNPALARDLINQEFGLNLSLDVVEPVHKSIEALELDGENIDITTLYENLIYGEFNDLEVEELLRVADRTDMDPDVQKTVMLGLINNLSNSIQTMNAIQAKLASNPPDESKLANFIGINTIRGYKDSSSYISNYKFGAVASARMTIHSISNDISKIGNKVGEVIGSKFTEIKSKMPTVEMTDMDVAKKVYQKIVSMPKKIDLSRITKKKRARMM